LWFSWLLIFCGWVWPVPIVVVDILWGMILSGLVSATGFLAATRLFSITS